MHHLAPNGAAQELVAVYLFQGNARRAILIARGGPARRELGREHGCSVLATDQRELAASAQRADRDRRGKLRASAAADRGRLAARGS